MDYIDLSEHLGTLLMVMGLLWTALLGCLIYIFNGLRGEVKEIKNELSKLSDAIGVRVGRLETGLAELWGEHKATHKK